MQLGLTLLLCRSTLVWNCTAHVFASFQHNMFYYVLLNFIFSFILNIMNLYYTAYPQPLPDLRSGTLWRRTMQFFSHDLVMVAFLTVLVLLWHAPALDAKTGTAAIAMASGCSLTSFLTPCCAPIRSWKYERRCNLAPCLSLFIRNISQDPLNFGHFFSNNLSQIRSNMFCQGGHLLQLPALRDAAVVKVHPSIGAAALRTALVMAKKTVPWQLEANWMFQLYGVCRRF